MAPKKMIPAPIDRPLSRAYLREFSGWSTEFPPGLSDPTSLRLMENTLVNRDGSLRIRPGMRYISYAIPPSEDLPGIGLQEPSIVGTHEAFFLNDGTKAYLFAVREEVTGNVGFRVLALDTSSSTVLELTEPRVDFLIPQGESVLEFSPATTYVKYLQIDNKIFALSNAGESMRLFEVGDHKSAIKLTSIEKPSWTVDDKLSIVHPEAAWSTSGVPTSLRTNLLKNPSFTTLLNWTAVGNPADLSVSSTEFKSGTTSLEVKSLPERTNLAPQPLHDVATTGVTGWSSPYAPYSTVTASGNYLRMTIPAGVVGRKGYAASSFIEGIKAGESYGVAIDLDLLGSNLKPFLLTRFYSSAGVQVGADQALNYSALTGRKIVTGRVAPSGAVKMKVYLGAEITNTSTGYFHVRNLTVTLDSELDNSAFSGASGTNYFWEGATNASASVYHPPADISLWSNRAAVPALASVVAALWFKASSSGVNGLIGVGSFSSSDSWLGSANSASVGITTGWVQKSKISSVVASATSAAITLVLYAVPRGTSVFIDSGLLEKNTSLLGDFDGDTTSFPGTAYAWTGTPNGSSSTETEFTAPLAIPVAETRSPDTLISDNSSTHENDYSFGFFYCFSNAVGDSAASQVTVVKAQRSWFTWKWETANVSGEPSGTATLDPAQAADQLVAIMPEAVFDEALAQGATSWSLYMLTWSDQDSVPVEGLLVAQRDLTESTDYDSVGWARITPQTSSVSDDSAIIPTANNRYNYSNPSKAGNGLVAADRMVVVKDPSAAAVIRWSSNRQGAYSDFTASRGGGYKTLTSGNLYVPACVKLWQNPQSVDTLTILCVGIDGTSTGYYMAPAQVTSQSDNSNIMGFEETTATPGTTSPYGVEVLNNALYHPLEDQLMKSTATNYNINHKSLTDQIQTSWSRLTRKDQIISSQLDNRIYYVVNNPRGAALEEGMNGNEIWVFDAQSDKGTWSRWLVQAHSLRKIEYGGLVRMSVVRPHGIYYFDWDYNQDDYFDIATEEIHSRSIPWRIETNTQGANRAHDAWARLQQVSITLGNFQGSMEYGVRGWDINGKPVDTRKIYRDLNDPDLENFLPFDIDDSLRIGKDMQQWYLYASSVTEDDVVLPSFGQINSVQYRYTPVTVNTGYEYGSIETFEYGRATANWLERTTDAGIPQPYTDVRRP